MAEKGRKAKGSKALAQNITQMRVFAITVAPPSRPRFCPVAGRARPLAAIVFQTCFAYDDPKPSDHPRRHETPVFETFVIVYLVLLNVAAFWAFAHDKRAAIAGARRISEDRLLALAFLGGSIGAKLGQLLLRHKIRKEPFRQQLNGILAVQIVAMAAVLTIYVVQTGTAPR